jgi:carbonic anhydrase
MREKFTDGNPAMRLKVFAAICAAAMPVLASAAWQTISAEPSRRVEIDRESINRAEPGRYTALGRIVLEKPINDPKTSSSYRIIEALNRYDCAGRTISTIKRSYFRDEGDLLREEEVKVPMEMPVHSGSLDDKLLREVCRPKSGADARVAASKTAEMVNEAADELRKANEALLQKDMKRGGAKEPTATGAALGENPALATGHRARKSRTVAYTTCDNGKRQSPIDIRDGIRVDLEPIQFAYRPSLFRVVDNGQTIQVSMAGGGSISLLGKAYQLTEFHFHRPSGEVVNGKSYDMSAHLVHKSEDGKLAIVAVLLERGVDNPLIQTVWNNLPLEKNDDVAPPVTMIDLGQLLPETRDYYTYMGSRTTPPCSEGVLWIVLKQPQRMSAEQMAIFGRLYKNNARPVQPGFGRMVKESR